MKAKATVFSIRAGDTDKELVYTTIGVLVLGRKLVFVAYNERDHELYGAPIEAAALAHKENGVTLEEIFDHHVEKDFGIREAWSGPTVHEGKNEREIGEAILARAKLTDEANLK